MSDNEILETVQSEETDGLTLPASDEAAEPEVSETKEAAEPEASEAQEAAETEASEAPEAAETEASEVPEAAETEMPDEPETGDDGEYEPDVVVEDRENFSSEIVIYQTADGSVALDVPLENETVWLTQKQMQELFGRDISGISRHIANVFKDGEVEKEGNIHYVRSERTGKPIAYYSLDVIIPVGYRVRSKRAVEFRKWASKVLKQFILRGYAVNEQRMKQLGEVINIMKRTGNLLEARQILDVVDSFSVALDLLDDYDHQCISKPKGTEATYVLTYDECRALIDGMKFSADSDLFGNEKDDSFKASIAAIYQTFFGEDVYPSLQEKAANLLYFVTKNHSFSDGNKRIAAAVFLYFLDKNGILYNDEGDKIIADYTLVAITLMIAESRAEEKEAMVSLIMNFLNW